MNLGLRVVLVGLVLAGCGDDDDDSGSSAERTAKVVAASLTSNVVFADGVVEIGDIPATSESTVSLKQEDQVLTLAPMATQIMALEVDNPNEDDDPVTATLMQFEGDDEKHIEVPKKAGSGADGGAANEIMLDFSVGDDVCAKLCNETFTISMIQAVKLKKGGISKHLKRTIKLDCTDDGDPDLCEDKPSSVGKDAGTSTSGRGGSSSSGSGGATATVTNAGQEFGRALGTANLALCSCPEFMATPQTCSAMLPQTAVSCVQMSAIANGDISEVLAVINSLTADLKAAANACNSCDLSTCHPNVVKDALPMLPDDVAAEWEACATDKGGMIGGTPADAGAGASDSP